MVNYLDIYNQTVAGGQEKYASENVDPQEAEKFEMLEKYASLADEMLSNEFGNEFSQDDVVELAQMLINNDIAYEEGQEKVAEAYQLGVIIGQGFKDSVNQ